MGGISDKVYIGIFFIGNYIQAQNCSYFMEWFTCFGDKFNVTHIYSRVQASRASQIIKQSSLGIMPTTKSLNPIITR